MNSWNSSVKNDCRQHKHQQFGIVDLFRITFFIVESWFHLYVCTKPSDMSIPKLLQGERYIQVKLYWPQRCVVDGRAFIFRPDSQWSSLSWFNLIAYSVVTWRWKIIMVSTGWRNRPHFKWNHDQIAYIFCWLFGLDHFVVIPWTYSTLVFSLAISVKVVLQNNPEHLKNWRRICKETTKT